MLAAHAHQQVLQAQPLGLSNQLLAAPLAGSAPLPRGYSWGAGPSGGVVRSWGATRPLPGLIGAALATLLALGGEKNGACGRAVERSIGHKAAPAACCALCIRASNRASADACRRQIQHAASKLPPLHAALPTYPGVTLAVQGFSVPATSTLVACCYRLPPLPASPHPCAAQLPGLTVEGRPPPSGSQGSLQEQHRVGAKRNKIGQSRGTARPRRCSGAKQYHGAGAAAGPPAKGHWKIAPRGIRRARPENECRSQ